MRLLGRYLNSTTEANKIRDLCERAASEHVERSQVAPRATFSKLKPDQISEILDRYEAGERTVDIARDFEIGTATIRHLRRRRQVKARPIGMSEADIDLAADLYGLGMSLRKIATRIGFSSKTVTKELRLRSLIPEPGRS